MKDTCRDLRDEYRELDALCSTLNDEEWQHHSAFHGWTPWDEIAHLCYFDETALQAATDPAAFADGVRILLERGAWGEPISAVARHHFRSLDGAALLGLWRMRYARLVDTLATHDPKGRLPWYGPPMSARSFATARLMECWAHGQDIWDVLGRRRPPSARLKHIAHIGATTFGWTFVNRKLPVPESVPYIELAGPSGAVWTWGEPSATDFVRGSAEDFCLVVTQRRHLDDTTLEVAGDPASQWMSMAQCFAGPPADGPAAGLRRIDYSSS